MKIFIHGMLITLLCVQPVFAQTKGQHSSHNSEESTAQPTPNTFEKGKIYHLKVKGKPVQSTHITKETAKAFPNLVRMDVEGQVKGTILRYAA